MLLIAVESIVFVALSLWVGKAYLADVVSQTVSTEDLALASRLDPSNSEYHLQLGRLYEYSLSDINPTRAIEELNQAAQLNPLDEQAWLDLGAAEEVRGQIDQAAASLRRADYLAPYLSGAQWAIANFFLLHGDVNEALRHFKKVLAGTQQFNEAIFDTAWKAVGNGDQILAALIPDNLETQIRYLWYLLGRNKLPEAESVWQRIVTDHREFDPMLASTYIDTLMRAGLEDQAYQAWTELQQRHLISESTEAGNLLSNGDFEADSRYFGFAWRINPTPGVYTALDTTVFHSGGHSLLISFSGKSNLFYQAVTHWVKVTPGVEYQAQAYMKTDGITTDSGPRLWVFDPLKPAALSKFSEQLVGTNAGWTLLTVDFVPKETHYVTVAITRVPSQKLDNLISGKVWVDDVSVKPLDEAEHSAAAR